MKYITTPIYYVNDVPHIGHAYTTIIADTLAKFYRLSGEEVLFLTGTDEHGQKIEQAAKTKNIPVKQYVDNVSLEFKKLWDEINITYDIYARTTNEKHIKLVQNMFLKMFEKGDIYKGEYEGYYCISCESFFTKTQLVNDCNCPDCGKKTNLLKEESYFFKLSKYQDQILNYLENNEIIKPKNKANEIINFIKSGLKDLSITRTSFTWGINLPKQLNDDKHIIYVWLDALFIYYSSLDDDKLEFWKNCTHFVGKDILRFHAIYWPAFLLSTGLDLPKTIGAHGWWTKDGEKMSKSKGNVIKPKEIIDAYGIDAFRYFLLREIPFGNDGDFNENTFINRINSELCNELGNLLNRIIGMSSKYCDFNIYCEDIKTYFDEELNQVNSYIGNSLNLLKDLQFSRYLEELFKALSLANLSISKYEPWNLIKNNETKKANALIGLCANILAKVSIMLYPALSNTSLKISKALNYDINTKMFNDLILDKKIINFKAKEANVLFEKIFEPKLVKQKEQTTQEINLKEQIKIEDFNKIQIQVAKVVSCQNVEGSEKLLKFQLQLDNNKIIQVLSGIAKYYNPKDLINEQVCVITNLKKAKIFGHESHGMILSAKDKDKLVLISPKQLVEDGSLIG